MSRRRIDPKSNEFSTLFETFVKSAFRLETLQQYGVDYESGPMRAFLAGEPPPPPTPKSNRWRAMMRRQLAAGKTMERVHVVAEPLSEYLQFELTWGYAVGAEEGEDIRILPRPNGEWPDELPPPGYDYWMFDNCDVYRMHYDATGDLVDLEHISEPAAVSAHVTWRELAMSQAVPLDDYLQRFPALLRRRRR